MMRRVIVGLSVFAALALRHRLPRRRRFSAPIPNSMPTRRASTRKGTDVEDYGSWRCPGYGGLIVYLSAGDQRMQVSFGTSAKKAEDEVAAGETFPGFNSVYEGTVEWRIEKLPNGKTRPFATILRWNTRTEADAERDDGKSTGRTLVVTRLNPGGVCHVGYVDARSARRQRSGAQARR